MRTMSASERQALLKLASALPKGSEERSDLLLIAQYSKPVRGASSGSVRYAFSVSSLVSDFFNFFTVLGEEVEKLAKMLESVDLEPEDAEKINRACEAAAKAINKALGTPVKQQASLPKKGNLLGVAMMSASLKAAGKRNPQALEDFSLIMFLPLILALGMALGPIFLAVKALEVAFHSAKYVATGKESPLHEALRKHALSLIKYADTKQGFLQKVLKFLSKFVHSKPSPDPFGEKGSVFDLFGLYDADWYKGAHPYGTMTLNQAENTINRNPVPYHYSRKGVPEYWLFDTSENSWWGYDSQKRTWFTSEHLGYGGSAIKKLLGEVKPLDFKARGEATLTRIRS